MDVREQMSLTVLIAQVLSQQQEAGFSPQTTNLYRKVFHRLEKLADEMNVTEYCQDLADRFVADSADRKTGEYCHSRFLLHARCIHFLDSYIKDGITDWSVSQRASTKALSAHEFRKGLSDFKNFLTNEGLKSNTLDGYIRFVFYFLHYLEGKGYTSLAQVKTGDITFFMTLVCQEHYEPTSIGAHLPGLRRFVQYNAVLKPFESEIPLHSPKKVPIIETYTDEELTQVNKVLESSTLSARNKAIALIAFHTGLRAVDICQLQLRHIDWKHDTISIIQEKTGKPLTIPLFPELGNALSAYLLEERPESASPYVFLSWAAPFRPLRAHAGIRNILCHILEEARVEPDGRISGTRMTRHSYASRMLRKGIPLSVISQALGHNSPNSTMRYLSTDNKMMASCTLPLPEGGLQ